MDEALCFAMIRVGMAVKIVNNDLIIHAIGTPIFNEELNNQWC
jgi:hypothetical protein